MNGPVREDDDTTHTVDTISDVERADPRIDAVEKQLEKMTIQFPDDC